MMRAAALGLTLASGFVIAVLARPGVAAERTVTAPAPRYDPPAAPVAAGTRKVALLAGGCFWGVEAVFERVRGVISVESGYAGGTTPDPSYEQIGTGTTGHAETVRIVYDPARVSYGTLLRIFMSVAHDPTQKNRQGPDVGTQYRGAIFPLDAAQRKVAAAYLAQLGRTRLYGAPIATRIEPATRFTPAEPYHQDFMRRNPDHPYIVKWDRPKLHALKVRFPGAWRA